MFVWHVFFCFVLSSQHKERVSCCKKPCHSVVCVCFVWQSWPFVGETAERQCFWPSWALPMHSGGFTWDICISVLTPCQATFWMCTGKGKNMVTAQRVAGQEDRVLYARHSDLLRPNTAGRGRSACQQLQLWIQHRRLSSHTSDWWDWTNLLVCNLHWLKWCFVCLLPFSDHFQIFIFYPSHQWCCLERWIIRLKDSKLQTKNKTLSFSFLLFFLTRDLSVLLLTSQKADFQSRVF